MPNNSACVPKKTAGNTTSTTTTTTTKVLSCLNCQQRKKKCDKQTPCSICIKQNTECIPSTPTPRRRRRQPTRELLDRMTRCEELLRQCLEQGALTRGVGVGGGGSGDGGGSINKTNSASIHQRVVEWCDSDRKRATAAYSPDRDSTGSFDDCEQLKADMEHREKTTTTATTTATTTTATTMRPAGET